MNQNVKTIIGASLIIGGVYWAYTNSKEEGGSDAIAPSDSYVYPWSASESPATPTNITVVVDSQSTDKDEKSADVVAVQRNVDIIAKQGGSSSAIGNTGIFAHYNSDGKLVGGSDVVRNASLTPQGVSQALGAQAISKAVNATKSAPASTTALASISPNAVSFPTTSSAKMFTPVSSTVKSAPNIANAANTLKSAVNKATSAVKNLLGKK